MALFTRVRSRLSGCEVTDDPHDWKLPNSYSISSSTGKASAVPKVAELRNAFVPAANYASPTEALVYPDSSHTAVHLCLLECFRNLRRDAMKLDLQSYKPPSYSETASTQQQLHDERLPASVHWGVLVQLAATRFTTWWNNIDSVLNHASMYVIRGGARNEVQLSANYLPPLDVLMVWYALMLENHGEYTRACHQAADLRLKTLCFPWPAIRDVIDRENMGYNLPRAAQNLFMTISEQEADILKYLDTPPAYTESVASPFDIDLVAQVHVQQPFIDASHDALWIRSPALHGSLRRASIDYLRAQSSGRLIHHTTENLPYGTELIWRTHRLFPARYSAYSRDIVFEASDTLPDLKVTRSSEMSTSSSSTSTTNPHDSERDPCICWVCERIRDDLPQWSYDKATKACDLTVLQSLTADDVRQIQDDVGFHRTVENNRRAGLPLPTRPLTAAEREAEKLEAKKRKDAGILPGIGEYVEILPNGKTKIRVSKYRNTTYGMNRMIF